MKSLRKLLPYFTPYRIPLATGLFLVVASSAFTSVIPWRGRYWTLLRRQQLEESIEQNAEVLAAGVSGGTIAP